jgi:hypothetical protein
MVGPAPFWTHRIELAPGRFTMDGEGVDAKHDVRTAILCRELGEAIGQSTVVDWAVWRVRSRSSALAARTGPRPHDARRRFPRRQQIVTDATNGLWQVDRLRRVTYRRRV